MVLFNMLVSISLSCSSIVFLIVVSELVFIIFGQFDIRSNNATMVLYSSPFTQGCRRHHSSSRIRLNSIAIDPRNPYYLAVGGSDEYARVYDTRRVQLAPVCRHVLPDAPVNTFCPRHLRETNSVHITGLAYSKAGELLVSYNDELIYLFEKNMGYGSSPVSVSPEKLQEMEEPQVYTGHRNAQTVKGVNFFGPNDEYVTSGSDCGHIFIWKKKGGKLVRAMVGDRRVVNQLESHPHIPLLASCGIEKSVKLWTPMSNDVLSLPEKIEKVNQVFSQPMFNVETVSQTLKLYFVGNAGDGIEQGGERRPIEGNTDS